tara:strand:- start:45 stop:443 length:399 start_codon:yes stop_codon:yes gene_type:complete
MDKYFYFRSNPTIADDDDSAQSLMIPVSRFRGMLPSNSGANGTAADELTLFFEPVNNDHSHANNDFILQDTVLLNITVGKSLQVIKAIGEAITGHKHSDGVIVVADDLSTNTVVLDSGIASCGAITVAAQLS